MEVLELLEKKIDFLLDKIEKLAQENKRLKDELEKEKRIKEDVLKRVDNLLQKMEDIDIT